MIVNYESVLSLHQWYTYEIGQFCSPIVRDILAKCDLAAQLKGNEVGFGTVYDTAPETGKTVTGGNTHFSSEVRSLLFWVSDYRTKWPMHGSIHSSYTRLS